jgi:outer membrane protein OmpA-like peptidoglycan-associated protein
LNGTVTDEDVHAAVTGAAAAAYGAGNVTDDIAVVGAVTAPDLSAAANALAAILATLPGNLETGTFELVDTTLSLSGVASGIDALDAINEAAASATGVEVTADLGAAPDAVIDSLSGLLELEPITFETNSDVITAESQTTLDKSAGYLRAAFIANPGLRVEIGGHTDDHGDPVYNLELSNRRASAVLQYLTDHGVPATGLTATGYGMDRPIADNATADGRAQNRRIEFTILEG